MLTYTLDMEHVLKNNARYLQPLRQTGMKVCLVIKGGGTGLGFANLSDGQINDFVAQVKAAVATFKLDGVKEPATKRKEHPLSTIPRMLS